MTTANGTHETNSSALARPVVSQFSFINAAIRIRSIRDPRLRDYGRAWAGRGFKVYACQTLAFALDSVKPGEVYFVIQRNRPFALVGAAHAVDV